MPPKNNMKSRIYLWFICYALHNRFPNPRLLHLAVHGKNRRIRKKNIKRIMRGD